MAVIEYRVGELKDENERTRVRLHKLESDRATLRMVVEQMKTLVENMEEIAERVAQKTVTAMLEQNAIRARTWRGEMLRFVELGIALIGAYFLFRR